jgi:transposase
MGYELKEEFREIYETPTTVKMALRGFKRWLTYARYFFSQTTRTLEKYLLEICHYFVNRTTSGTMEGLNNKIKLILRQSYGFSDFVILI